MSDTTLRIDKIICPTDFSEFAESAFAESVRLARRFGAEVTVLHVMPFAVPVGGDVGYVPIPLFQDEAVRKAKLLEIRRFVDAIEHTGVPVDTAYREGNPSEEIRSAVREARADLVVMGTHGRSGFKRLALGSVTEAVLRDPPASVLIVRHEVAPRRDVFRRIVCATDISERTERTIAAALALADEGAEALTVLNVIEEGRESSRRELERAALEALRTLIPDEARSSYRIEEHVAFGEAGREIVRIAAEEEADLVVMGNHRHGPLGGLFGSTVRDVLREAPCPVLLVPPAPAWPVEVKVA
jgi:nucleotide-binding universal stress UspA family protein